MTNSNLVAVFDGKIANQSVQLANARELHQFLESKQDYSHWIKNRISDYGFVENEDYIIVTERTNGRPRKEYHITLDMGKELGMVERNEKGRQIRKYFIECEKRLKALQNSQPNLPLVEEHKFNFEFTEHELQTMAWIWFIALRGTETCRMIYPAMETIGSKFSGAIYGQAYEYRHTIREVHKLLKRLTADFQYDYESNWRVLKHLNNYDPKSNNYQVI